MDGSQETADILIIVRRVQQVHGIASGEADERPEAHGLWHLQGNECEGVDPDHRQTDPKDRGFPRRHEQS